MPRLIGGPGWPGVVVEVMGDAVGRDRWELATARTWGDLRLLARRRPVAVVEGVRRTRERSAGQRGGAHAGGRRRRGGEGG